MHSFALYGIVVKQFVFLCQSFLVGKLLVFKCRELRCYIRQHKEVFVVHLLCEPVCTLVGKVAGVQFFVNHKIQRLNSLRHLTVVVFHIYLLCLEHTCLYTFF